MLTTTDTSTAIKSEGWVRMAVIECRKMANENAVFPTFFLLNYIIMS